MGAKATACEPARQGWRVLPLLLLAFVLRVYDLGGAEFWFDEALTANVSGLGWQGILAHLSISPFEHPPLYFLSLYPWQRLLGTSEFAFRFYSVLWGVLLVALLYALIRRLANQRLALMVAAVAVFSPFLVAYSREARMYSLLPFLAALTVLLFFTALRRPQQPAWWLAYLMVLTGGVATHYYFAWIWLANSLFLALEVLGKRRISLWAVAVHVLAPVAVLLWLLAAPGLRISLARVWQGEMAFSLAYKMVKVMPTLVLSELEGGDVPLLASPLAAAGWLLALLGAWSSRRGTILPAPVWRLLLLLLVVPLAGSFLVPYSVVGRHLGYLLVPLSVFWALGFLALARRGSAWLAMGLVVFLFFASYGLVAHYGAGSDRSFGQALAYIDERARAGDTLILTQPGQHPLEMYYNRHQWPVRYLPPSPGPLDAAEVEATLLPLIQAGHRLWLGPVGAWTADPENLVARWLAAHAFAAEQTWFPDSHAVSLFLAGDADLVRADVEHLVWGGQMRLRSLDTSALQVEPGDAVRLRFRWRAGLDIPERYQMSVLLVDGDGLVWASRQSEPCSGWCPTDTWKQGGIQEDRLALMVPPGTPPGDYRLQVAWAPLAGGPRLEVETEGERVQAVTLAQVTVLPGQPWHPIPSTLPNAGSVAFGNELVLVGHEPATAELRPGDTLRLETHWQAQAEPQAAYELQAQLVDESGQVVHNWQFSPSSGTYPTDLWEPGEYVRGQHLLVLPSSLPSGSYELRIALLGPEGRLPVSHAGARDGAWPLASIRVLDRARQFDLPHIEHPLQVRIGRQARLLGYDLDTSQAYPGGRLAVTLYWQADGPMALPFKVFTHLVGPDGGVAAQHDGPPGQGCCPASTWAAGEVIVDEHVLPLGADLAPGGFVLVAGLYDEDTKVRVPAYDNSGNRLTDDRVEIGAIEVSSTVPGSEGRQAVPTPQFSSFSLYLPWVCREPGP
jgi:predicted membrane-bound mannosyltransferase